MCCYPADQENVCGRYLMILEASSLLRFSNRKMDLMSPWCREFITRSKKVDAEATVTIATSKTQVSAIHNQLGEDVGISVEPCRRDTFPAIALATAYLVDVLGVSPEESVVVCPVDPYVETDYFEALKKLSDQADKEEENLVLMGIEPTYPSEKYGYIIPATSEQTAMVSTFKEKPTMEVAKEYISQGVCGMVEYLHTS